MNDDSQPVTLWSCSADIHSCKISAMTSLPSPPLGPSEIGVTRSGWPVAHHLGVAGHRRIAWRVIGAPTAPVWLVLHGGPGSGGQAGQIAAFDLRRHRVVLPDQRGSGACRPKAETQGNRTAALVSDLERLRQHLGIERWSLLAGSWGTVLALAYADRHPDRVERLVLRGAFALSRRELRGVLRPPRALAHRVGREPLWPGGQGESCAPVLRVLEQVLQSGTPGVAARRLVRHWGRVEQALALRGMERGWRHAVLARQTELATQTRRQVTSLRRGLRQQRAQARRPGAMRGDAAAWQKFRIQAHYLRSRGFMRPGDLDAAVRRLALCRIRMDWVHGRFDAVCPPANSLRWHRLANALEPGVSQLHAPNGGHLGSEPALLAALRALVAA